MPSGLPSLVSSITSLGMLSLCWYWVVSVVAAVEADAHDGASAHRAGHGDDGLHVALAAPVAELVDLVLVCSGAGQDDMPSRDGVFARRSILDESGGNVGPRAVVRAVLELNVELLGYGGECVAAGS